jgi:hypothetical protein
LILRILEEIRGRPGTTTLTHVVNAHQRDNQPQPTNSAFPLDSTSRHQEYNKIADRLAKNSLTLEGSPLVPDEHTYLPPVHIILPIANPAVSSRSVINKNNPQKLYHTAYSSSPHLKYHMRGMWHLYLFDDSIWYDPLTSILLCKRGSLHKKLLVQILGRTLPTFRRLNKIRPRLYLTNTCILCPQLRLVEESIEHLLFRCPFFLDCRQLLHDQLLSTCRRLSLPIATTTLRTMIQTLLLPSSLDQTRFFFAGQLPSTFQFWLQSYNPSRTRINKLGNALHKSIVEASHDI